MTDDLWIDDRRLLIATGGGPVTDDYLGRHRAHDYPHLVERWRALAKRTGMVVRRFAAGPEFKLYFVRSAALPREGAIYISAGIHGDEPAGPEALITWAEKNTRLLRRRPFLLVPCINPWGLVNNSRFDSIKRDLNRSFQDNSIPEVAALKRAMGRRRFSWPSPCMRITMARAFTSTRSKAPGPIGARA